MTTQKMYDEALANLRDAEARRDAAWAEGKKGSHPSIVAAYNQASADVDAANLALLDAVDAGADPGCRGCTGTCCTGVGSEPCTCG